MNITTLTGQVSHLSSSKELAGVIANQTSANTSISHAISIQNLTFRLNGKPVSIKSKGSQTIDLSSEDKATVAGKLGKDGIFQALSIRNDETGVTYNIGSSIYTSIFLIVVGLVGFILALLFFSIFRIPIIYLLPICLVVIGWAPILGVVSLLNDLNHRKAAKILRSN